VRSRVLSGAVVVATCAIWPVSSAAETPPAVGIQQPPSASNVALDGISCPTDGMCVAVGSAQNKQFMRSGLVERWDGSRW
jgi:hypothetical protein